MKKLFFTMIFALPVLVDAQQVSMDDMSYWKPSGKTNWQVASDVTADLNKHDVMTLTAGRGVLVNLPNSQNKANLVSIAEHGDAEIEFDFMMAAHSNSGFYLQGRYEMQLLDSWGVKNPTTGDCGGIYKRRKYVLDANNKYKEYLWEGHAPRVNACLAPGLWQHVEISFQAPRFDASGKKTANAKVLKLTMNGVLLHENLEMTGPTGGPIAETEVASGPVMIQGDHGPVAFRNMKISNLIGKPAELTNLNYKVFYGKFKEPKDFLSKTPDATGTFDKLTWDVSKQPNDFAEIFTGKIKVAEAGKHKFTFQLGGKYYVNIGGKEVLPDAWTFTNDQRKVAVDLPAGDVPIEITVYKTDGWMPPITGLWIAGPSFRETAYHTVGSMLAGPPNDPIMMDAPESTVLRSFSDITLNGKTKRVTHAVNVGNPDKLHYTYDMDNGAIAQIWKGDFLNMSPMWDNRGDGSSKPRGAVLPMGTQALFVQNSQKNIIVESLPTDANFKTLGYDLDENSLPTFRYQIFGSEIEDQIRVAEGKFLTRSLSVKNNNASNLLVCRLAVGKDIVKISEDTYSVNGKSFYIKATGASIEKSGDNMMLFMPVSEKIVYSIMW
jgi:hypothetical protein